MELMKVVATVSAMSPQGKIDNNNSKDVAIKEKAKQRWGNTREETRRDAMVSLPRCIAHDILKGQKTLTILKTSSVRSATLGDTS